MGVFFFFFFFLFWRFRVLTSFFWSFLFLISRNGSRRVREGEWWKRRPGHKVTDGVQTDGHWDSSRKGTSDAFCLALLFSESLFDACLLLLLYIGEQTESQYCGLENEIFQN